LEGLDTSCEKTRNSIKTYTSAAKTALILLALLRWLKPSPANFVLNIEFFRNLLTAHSSQKKPSIGCFRDLQSSRSGVACAPAYGSEVVASGDALFRGLKSPAFTWRRVAPQWFYAEVALDADSLIIHLR